MILNITKRDLVDNILSPVSKLADNAVLDFCSEEGKWTVKTTANTSDGVVIFLGESFCTVTEHFKCIIPECKTFLRLFSNITEEQLKLSINDNHIEYKNADFSFKYYLLDESYMTSKKIISEEKLKKINFDTTFIVNKNKLSEIIKYATIVADAEKIYFLTKDNKVVTKIGDDLKANTNEISMLLANDFEGNSIDESICFNIQNLTLFCFSEDSIKVKINKDLKLLMFETKHQKYVMSGLIR